MNGKDVVRKSLDAANRGVATADEDPQFSISPDYRLFERGRVVAHGEEGVEGRLDAIRAFMPDATQRIDEMVREGDTVVLRWTLTGTRTGEFFGVPPDGAEISVQGITWHHMKGDLIGDTWMSWDRLQLLEQVLPSPRAATP